MARGQRKEPVKDWWQLKQEAEERERKLKEAVLGKYSYSASVGLIRMITHLAGRKVVNEAGEEQHFDPQYLNDGFYIAEFEGGFALLVDYTAFSNGSMDSFGNRGADRPAKVAYTLYSMEPL